MAEPNPFDQFDAPSPAAGANPFDQFDAPRTDAAWSLAGARATPEGQKLESELRSKADRMLLKAAGAESPGYAGITSAANTALLNAPRNVGALVRSLKTGRPFEQEYSYLRDVDEAAARQSPVASGVGTAAGVLGQAAALPVAPAASLAGRMAQGAAIGAGAAGVADLADTKDLASAGKSALGGALIGGAAAPVLAGVAKLANAGARATGLSRTPSIPATEELRDLSQAAYKRADAAGLVVNREGIRNIAGNIKTALAEEAYHPKNQPKLSNFLNELESLSFNRGVPGEPRNIGVTLSGLDTTRKMLRAARMSPDREEARMARIAADHFDNYLSNLKPSEVVAGDIREGVEALKEARSLWSSYRKADLVDDAIEAARLRAASTGSGGNVDNAIRQEFRKILQSPKKSGAFTSDEKAALARIVTGTKGQNTLRLLGKLSPTGGGLQLMLGTGAMASGGATVPIGALGALGAAAKHFDDNATPKNVERLSKIIRARGLNIDPQDLVNAARTERLRNFFTSIGVNVDKMASDLGGGASNAMRNLAGQTPARADSEDTDEIPAVRR